MKIFTSMVLLIGLPAAVAMAEPDIEVQKSVNNAFPIANEPVEFTIEVSNVGDETAADVIIVDPLPSEMVIPANDAAFPSMGSYDPVTGEWAVGNLEAGMSAVLGVPAVVIEPQPPACIVNSALSEHLDDVNDTNNEARAAIHQDGVERCVDLSARFNSETSAAIGVTGFHIFPECGVEERYIGSVEIRNMGPDAARNVVITISQTPLVGAEMRFENAACQPSGMSVCTVAEIASGEILLLNVTSDLFQNSTTAEQRIDVEITTRDIDYAPMNNLLSADEMVSDFSSCREINFGDDIGPSVCFVATAAYGSALHPHIDSLRNFRDRFVMLTPPGRALVRFYYRYSPPLADFIATRDGLRFLVRGLLAPIVYTIEYPQPAALLFLSLLATVMVRRRRRGFHRKV